MKNHVSAQKVTAQQFDIKWKLTYSMIENKVQLQQPVSPNDRYRADDQNNNIFAMTESVPMLYYTII